MAAPVSIGLDVGSVSVRAVETVVGKGRPTIDAFGQINLPDGAVAGGVVKDQRAVTEAVKALWTTSKFKSKQVRLGVSHQQVVVREVEIADLPSKQLRQALPHQVRDSVPLPVEQAILDFLPLEKNPAKDTVRGLLAAVPKEPVIEAVQAVEKAGLHVARVDLACFAVLRAIATHTTGAEAIIDIGASGTLLVIHHDGVPQIVRTIPRGGDEVTRVLSARLAISAADAEDLKTRSYAGPQDEQMSGAGEAITDALRPLLSEIRSSLNFYAASSTARPVDRLTLVGRAGLLPGLVELLRDATGLTVGFGDPLQYVTSGRHRQQRDDLHSFRAGAAVSVGLSLGGIS